MFLDIACIIFVTRLYLSTHAGCYYIYPKFVVFTWLDMLKEQCLLLGPKHEVHSYIHATSVGQMFGTKQNDIYWNIALVLHGV
jgi:hypothetical protein